MNGSKTRYSSSSLLKNAQTWRLSPSCEPAKGIGIAPLFMFCLSRIDPSECGSVYGHDLMSGSTLLAAPYPETISNRQNSFTVRTPSYKPQSTECTYSGCPSIILWYRTAQ